MPIRGEPAHSLEVVQNNSTTQRGGSSSRGDGSRATLTTALKIFHDCFDRLEMSNGMDLVDMVCTSYETPDEEQEMAEQLFDFSNFRVLVLRQGATIVTCATLRVFGTKFAELPFVATRDGYRRAGNLKRLMQVRADDL